MDISSLILFLVIGAGAGWQAGEIMKGGGLGLAGNILIGIIGGVIGGFLYRLLAIAAGGLIGSIATATLGALVLLFVIGLCKKS